MYIMVQEDRDKKKRFVCVVPAKDIYTTIAKDREGKDYPELSIVYSQDNIVYVQAIIEEMKRRKMRPRVFKNSRKKEVGIAVVFDMPDIRFPEFLIKFFSESEKSQYRRRIGTDNIDVLMAVEARLLFGVNGFGIFEFFDLCKKAGFLHLCIRYIDQKDKSSHLIFEEAIDIEEGFCHKFLKESS